MSLLSPEEHNHDEHEHEHFADSLVLDELVHHEEEESTVDPLEPEELWNALFTPNNSLDDNLEATDGITVRTLRNPWNYHQTIGVEEGKPIVGFFKSGEAGAQKVFPVIYLADSQGKLYVLPSLIGYDLATDDQLRSDNYEAIINGARNLVGDFIMDNGPVIHNPSMAQGGDAHTKMLTGEAGVLIVGATQVKKTGALNTSEAIAVLESLTQTAPQFTSDNQPLNTLVHSSHSGLPNLKWQINRSEVGLVVAELAVVSDQANRKKKSYDGHPLPMNEQMSTYYSVLPGVIISDENQRPLPIDFPEKESNSFDEPRAIGNPAMREALGSVTQIWHHEPIYTENEQVNSQLGKVVRQSSEVGLSAHDAFSHIATGLKSGETPYDVLMTAWTSKRFRPTQ